MKRLSVIGACALLTLATGCSTAMAGNPYSEYDSEHFTDTARVTNVTPIYRTVRVAEPREECHEKEVHYRDRGYDDGYQSYTPMIAGGVVGGVVGNQFGKGNGKTFMTLAGTVLGGSIGRDLGHKYRHASSYTDYKPRTETRCEIVNDYREEEQIDGYRVTYKYHGKKFNTTLPYHPGNRLKLNVTLRPYE